MNNPAAMTPISFTDRPSNKIACPPNMRLVASREVRAVPRREARRPAMRGVQVLFTLYEARMILKSELLEPISRARRDLMGPRNSRPLFHSRFDSQVARTRPWTETKERARVRDVCLG